MNKHITVSVDGKQYKVFPRLRRDELKDLHRSGVNLDEADDETFTVLLAWIALRRAGTPKTWNELTDMANE